MRKFINKAAHKIVAPLLEPMDRIAQKRFNESPFGRVKVASQEEYERQWKQAKQESFPAVDELEVENGFAIDADWFHDLARITQVPITRYRVCYQHGRLLYSFIRKYVAEKKCDHLTVVETGTARGFSAICMAKAMQDANLAGRILSFDVLPHEIAFFWNSITDWTQGEISRRELLEDYEKLSSQYVVFVQGDTRIMMPKVVVPRIHFAFLDAVHNYEYVMREFRLIFPRQRIGDMIFFDDYSPELFPGVVQAVDEICGKFGYAKRVVRLDAENNYAIGTKRF